MMKKLATHAIIMGQLASFSNIMIVLFVSPIKLHALVIYFLI